MSKEKCYLYNYFMIIFKQIDIFKLKDENEIKKL